MLSKEQRDDLQSIVMHPFVSSIRTTNHPLARLRRALKQAAASCRNGTISRDANRNVSLTRLKDALLTEIPSDLVELINDFLEKYQPGKEENGEPLYSE